MSEIRLLNICRENTNFKILKATNNVLNKKNKVNQNIEHLKNILA